MPSLNIELVNKRKRVFLNLYGIKQHYIGFVNHVDFTSRIEFLRENL